MPNLSNSSDQNNQNSAVVKTNIPVATTQSTQVTSQSATKEQEPMGGNDSLVEEVGQEMQLSPELEQIGVQKSSTTINIPKELQQMGVMPTGATQTAMANTVVVPLTDDQIVQGLHAQILSSIRWLAEWCVKQLKKAHIHLKKLSGKVVREREM